MEDVQRKFNNSVEYVLSRVPKLNKYKINDVFKEIEGNQVEIYIPFDVDETKLVLTKEAFIEQVEEFKICEVNDSKNCITVKNTRYYPCYIGYQTGHGLKDKMKIAIETNEFHIGIGFDKTFLLGLIALEINAYHEEIQGPFTYEHCLIIKYLKEEDVFSEEKEKQLIATFRFELLTNTNIAFDTISFDTDWDFEEEEEEEVMIIKKQIVLKPLLQYDEGIKMYLVTEEIYDNQFKFLSLYKILEHYSLTALRVDVLESLAKKLDSPKSLNPDSKYLTSIIELASSFELRKRDKELIRTVILKSVDIIDIIEYCPQFIMLLLKENKIAYSAKKNDTEKVYQKVAEVLYATRNLLAHAKANYDLTGLECPDSELEQLIEFTNQMVIRTIKWYGRLPSYIK